MKHKGAFNYWTLSCTDDSKFTLKTKAACVYEPLVLNVSLDTDKSPVYGDTNFL